jgi:hypothetical protein
MRLIPLKKRVINIIDDAEPLSLRPTPDGGIDLRYKVLASHAEYLRPWLCITVKFVWRDIWCGVFVGENGKVYVCLIPCLPVIFYVS